MDILNETIIKQAALINSLRNAMAENMRTTLRLSEELTNQLNK